MPDNKPIETSCLVNSGSTYLCITQHIANQLGLKEWQRREVILADGSTFSYPYVGPVKIELENKMCFTGAVIMGDECMLGTIPMDDMDLVIMPAIHKIVVNPVSPNIASRYAN